METKTKFNFARRLLLFWCIFICIGAVGGAVLFWAYPHGEVWNMADMLPYFQVLPFADFFFRDFVWCGVALLCVNGLTNLTASVLILRHSRWGLVLGTVFGVTLILWILVQFCIFPLNAMDVIYFIFGILQTLTGLAALHLYKQLPADSSANADEKDRVLA